MAEVEVFTKGFFRRGQPGFIVARTFSVKGFPVLPGIRIGPRIPQHRYPNNGR